MEGELTVQDLKLLDERALAERNVALSLSVEIWTRRAKEQSRRAQNWRAWCITASVLFAVTWVAIFWAVLHG